MKVPNVLVVILVSADGEAGPLGQLTELSQRVPAERGEHQARPLERRHSRGGQEGLSAS